MKVFASVAVIIGVTLGLHAAPASASTAQLVQAVIPPECKYVPPGESCPPGSDTILVYEAGLGEANRVTLTRTPEELRVTDAGAVVEPGAGCSSIDVHGVRCSGSDIGVFVMTGGGADTIRLELTGRAIADGGAGDDLLLGGPGGDRLYGGKGDDVLRGGDGPDGLHDASLRQPLRSGDLSPFHEETVLALAAPGRGRDSFDGGADSDTVSYRGRLAGVRVDLANTAAIGGARGEHDAVRDVESAFGGAGDDRLAGNDKRNNELDGGGGDDRIAGRRGVDYIEGGPGRNVIFAGPGDDYVNSRYRGTDFGDERTFCGPGADNVSWIFPSDFLNDDCEDLEFNFLREGGLFGGSVLSLLPLRKDGTRVVLVAPELWCYFVANPSGCRLQLELLVQGPGTRRGTAPPTGTVLGSRSYEFAPNERKAVTFALSATGARILRRHRSLRVRMRADDGSPRPGGYLTVLRAPR
ncbi:MAG: hypothetical protein ACRDLY_06105 [Thermoleophilaceae bacterium]